ncbi:unnamed protein product [Owenia fusiformis]|uniref:Kinesin motor domain-containing protein n=1 Tax=Owenia fusiformis TaxID=6347 RepID=A0A8S4PXN1_OWEFU|nr:unnamed protein product [Owenia fusiformis]
MTPTQSYFSSFTSKGLSHSEQLAGLSMQDYVSYGVTNMDDRLRLFKIIKIIKSVKQSGKKCNHSNSSPHKGNENKNQINRNHSYHNNEDSNGKISRKTSYFPQSVLAVNGYIKPLDTQDIQHENTQGFKPPKTLHLPTEIVEQKTGYNYGVPKSKSKSKPTNAASLDGMDRIKVCVRTRPMMQWERETGTKDIVEIHGRDGVVIMEPKVALDTSHYTQQHTFRFDEAFHEELSNEDVYRKTIEPLVEFVMKGGKATCFAYGQTGAGKSYTMMGTDNAPGLYMLGARDIVNMLQPGHKIWISYFEIYCGQLFDLLNKRKRLHVRENQFGKVCVTGRMETEVKDLRGVMKVVENGNRLRSTGVTGVNADSSRSHAVIQMDVRDNQEEQLGRISFIDLAGSERAADVMDTDKQTRHEGAEINTSLLALKECIRSIDQEKSHTPFRQSKLTHVLKESFTGDSKTCMIANISPTNLSSEHTLNTLRYADRVKELQTDIKESIKNSMLNNNSRNSSQQNQSILQSPIPNAHTSRSQAMTKEHQKAGQPVTNAHQTPAGDNTATMDKVDKTQSTPAGRLFHPSTIQCSSTPKSTPVKSRVNVRDSMPKKDLNDTLPDEWDTPIKGHKLRKKSGKGNNSKSHSPKRNLYNEFEYIPSPSELNVSPSKYFPNSAKRVSSNSNSGSKLENDHDEKMYKYEHFAKKDSSNQTDFATDDDTDLDHSAVQTDSGEHAKPMHPREDSELSEMVNNMSKHESTIQENQSVDDVHRDRKAKHEKSPSNVQIYKHHEKEKKPLTTSPEDEREIRTVYTNSTMMSDEKLELNKNQQQLPTPEAFLKSLSRLRLGNSSQEKNIVKLQNPKETSDLNNQSLDDIDRNKIGIPADDSKEFRSLLHSPSNDRNLSKSLTFPKAQRPNHVTPKGPYSVQPTDNEELPNRQLVNMKEHHLVSSSPIKKEHLNISGFGSAFSPIAQNGIKPGPVTKSFVSNNTNLYIMPSAKKQGSLQAENSYIPVTPKNDMESSAKDTAFQIGHLPEAKLSFQSDEFDLMSPRTKASAIEKARNLVVDAHEEQLCEITSLCKDEMKLLLAVKRGNMTFDVYMQKLKELLAHKERHLETLREQINEFTNFPIHSDVNTSA